MSERVAQFVENLTHTEGPAAGHSFRLRPWQRDIVERIYGPRHADGRRIVRTAFITMPRKQGKTQLAAALALYHLLADGERGGQVYSAAADRGQAALIYNAAATMIRNDPELAERVNVIDSVKRIVHFGSGSFYQALSSESRTKHGFSASAIIYDELAQAPNRKLWDVLTTSTGARAQPLTIVISTVGGSRTSIMRELYEYAVKVRDGSIEDPTFVPVIYQAPEDADPWAEETWFACNPALGDFRSLEEMRMAAARAQRMPAAETPFRSLYLNQLVDAEARFLASADWLAGKGPVDPLALRGRKCWGGLDLSSTKDLTALTLVFPGEERTDVLAWFWLPGEQLLEREDRDRVPYRLWRDQGHLETTPGRAIDKRYVVRRLAEIASLYDVQGIAYDRWRIEDLKVLLAEAGVALPMKDWGQGFQSMGPALDALETAVLTGTLRHDSPILDWNSANAVVVSDAAGLRKLDKARSVERIDGLVALAMALGLQAKEQPEREWMEPLVLG